MYLPLRTTYGYADNQTLSMGFSDFPAGAVRALAVPATPLNEAKLSELAARYAVDCTMHVDARNIDVLYCFHKHADRIALIDAIAPYVTLLTQITISSEIARNANMIQALH
jgi:hypothetical protein